MIEVPWYEILWRHARNDYGLQAANRAGSYRNLRAPALGMPTSTIGCCRGDTDADSPGWKPWARVLLQSDANILIDRNWASSPGWSLAFRAAPMPPPSPYGAVAAHRPGELLISHNTTTISTNRAAVTHFAALPKPRSAPGRQGLDFDGGEHRQVEMVELDAKVSGFPGHALRPRQHWNKRMTSFDTNAPASSGAASPSTWTPPGRLS